MAFWLSAFAVDGYTFRQRAPYERDLFTTVQFPLKGANDRVCVFE